MTAIVVVFTMDPLLAVMVTTPFKAGAGPTVRTSFCVWVACGDALSVAVRVKVFTLCMVGRPVMDPVDEFRERPAGRGPVPVEPVTRV